MRITIYIFTKAGALKAMQSFPIEHINEVTSTATDFVPGYSNPNVWTPQDNAVALKDEYGWSKTKHNSVTGERCLVMFYNKNK